MDTTSIRESIERSIRNLDDQPTSGRGTLTAEAQLVEGLRVRVEGPDGFDVTTDMSRGVGGTGSGPSPASLARAALASCDATVIAMRAAQEGIPLTTLQVRVEWDYDSRGMLGVDEPVSAGPLAVRVYYRIGADGVTEEQLEELVEWAEAHSPVGDVFRRAIDYEVDLEIL